MANFEHHSKRQRTNGQNTSMETDFCTYNLGYVPSGTSAKNHNFSDISFQVGQQKMHFEGMGIQEARDIYNEYHVKEDTSMTKLYEERINKLNSDLIDLQAKYVVLYDILKRMAPNTEYLHVFDPDSESKHSYQASYIS